jgi:hypothetical protein
MIWRALRQFVASMAHTEPGPVAESPVICQGEYRLLHKYLESRFSSRVVLTFSEIEDLIGFTLPPQARIDNTWWSGAEASPGESRHAVAWTLTNRVAAVNLLAGKVAFERRG